MAGWRRLLWLVIVITPVNLTVKDKSNVGLVPARPVNPFVLDLSPKKVTIPLHNLNQDLVLTKIRAFKQLTPQECIVQFKACAAQDAKVPDWRRQDCNTYPFSSSFQIVSVDEPTLMTLNIYWYGTKYENLAESAEQQEYNFGLMDSVNWDLNENYRDWFQGNCGQVQAFAQQWKETYPKTVTVAQVADQESSLPSSKHEAGVCVVSLSDCYKRSDEEKEEWEKPEDCHPIENSFKIIKVGKRNYLVENWFGYSNNFFNLLGHRETVSFSYLDSQEFEEVSCSGLKKKYPHGNYSNLIKKRRKISSE